MHTSNARASHFSRDTRHRLFTATGILTVFIVLLSIAFGVINRQNAYASAGFRGYADLSAQVLQSYYSTSNGQWNTAQWWQSANMLETTINYMQVSGNSAYASDISTTYNLNSSGNFLNNYYDDEGWWALAWIKSYDYTGNSTYLSMARTIFVDISGGWDTSTCNGGVWWSKSRTYKNAIANELFLEVAARLHERVSGDTVGGGGPNGKSYIDWATAEWQWFQASGMINSQNLINDGLTSACQNNGQTTYTYNQGVILGGLVDLYKSTNDSSYLTTAETLANASSTTPTLQNGSGILVDPCEPGNCGADGAIFKGIYIKNLAYLQQADNSTAYRDFIARNATSIWLNDRDSSNHFGLLWIGPVDKEYADRQAEGQDLLNAAVLFTGNDQPTVVSQGKPVTADGSPCTSTQTAPNAVDGDLSTKWCEGGNSGWIYVDLGGPYTITQFTIRHAGAGGESSGYNTKAFSVQVTNDPNSGWTTVVNISNNIDNSTTHPISGTTARYARLFITTSQSSTSYIAMRIYEFQVFAVTPNLALNKSVTTNGSACNSNEIPSNAVDGNTSTKWCQGGGSEWIDIDLGATASIAQIIVRHAGDGGESTSYNTRDFNLQVGNGTTYTTVATVTGNTANITQSDFSPVSGNHVRLNVTTGSQVDTVARIYEIEVYSSSFSLGANGSDLSKNASVTTDGSPCNSNETAPNAVDNNFKTKWCEGGSTEWIQLHLTASQTLSRIVIEHAGTGGESTSYNTKTFNIQLSSDGANWTTICSIAGNTANETTITFRPMAASYIRLNVIVGSSTDTVARIYEVIANSN